MGYFELNRPMFNPGNTAGSTPAANLSHLFLTIATKRMLTMPVFLENFEEVNPA
ncbi:hypothetical protein D3C76_1373230 [compost metagenome]